jgi:hypothetical protein
VQRLFWIERAHGFASASRVFSAVRALGFEGEARKLKLFRSHLIIKSLGQWVFKD